MISYLAVGWNVSSPAGGIIANEIIIIVRGDLGACNFRVGIAINER